MLRVRSDMPKRLIPSRIAKDLLPENKVWCTTCHQSILKTKIQEHNEGWKHRIASRKVKKLQNLSLNMWAAHRGSALSEESAASDGIAREFESFRQSQQGRER